MVCGSTLTGLEPTTFWLSAQIFDLSFPDHPELITSDKYPSIQIYNYEPQVCFIILDFFLYLSLNSVLWLASLSIPLKRDYNFKKFCCVLDAGVLVFPSDILTSLTRKFCSMVKPTLTSIDHIV